MTTVTETHPFATEAGKCGAGMSRSIAVAAAAIARTNGQTPDAALTALAKTGPVDVCRRRCGNRYNALIESGSNGSAQERLPWSRIPVPRPDAPWAPRKRF